MKRSAILICLWCSISIAMLAKEKVIERPSFIARNADVLEISKIVQHNEATVLHIDAYFRPKYWIRIDPATYLLGDDGVKYPIQSTEGIPLGEEYYMPESGETSFRLIFPPLPESVAVVDFSEGDVSGGWNIWGIQLKTHKLPKLVLPEGINNNKPDKNATLPIPEFKEGKAILKGQLLDYRPGMDNKLICAINSCINVTSRSAEVNVADDGSFFAEIPVATLTPAGFHMSGSSIRFFLAPGEETRVYINQRELARSASRVRKNEKPEGNPAYYGGYMAELSNELAELRHIVWEEEDFQQRIKKAANKTVEEIRDDFLSERESKLAALDKYKMSPATKEVLKAEVDVLTINNLNYTPAIRDEAYVAAKKLSREEIDEYFRNRPPLSTDFYTIGFKDFTAINSPSMLYCGGYANIVNPYVSDRISKAIGTDKGLYFELSAVAQVLQQISDFQPVTQEQLDQLHTYSSPIFLALAERKSEELRQTIEANKKKSGFTINELGEVVNEDLFPSLIAKFSGKVILVDFWATWCGPCIKGHEEMAPMKEELKDKDIVYLYIAGENSPKPAWDNMITGIPGEHFRITKEQWKYLTDTFGVRGVPTYFVVNKEGEITYKQVGFPGADKIKEELQKQL